MTNSTHSGPRFVALTVGIVFYLYLLPPAAVAQLRKGARFENKGTCQGCHDDVDIDVSNPHAPLAQGDHLLSSAPWTRRRAQAARG